MKLRLALVLLLSGVALGFGQGEEINVDELVKSGERWLMDNADEKTLAALADMDVQDLERLCSEVQRRFEGANVLDLASIQQFANVLVPILEQHEETRAYAAWLRPRLDYFDVTQRLRPSIPPTKKSLPNPPPLQERQAWQKHVTNRPMLPAAEKYVPRLKSIFAAQHVPAELVWLAEVESMFDPRAKSPSGATGLFQLMPAAARSQGLSLRPWDERLNPDKNAQAAAKYLKYLHGSFRDWHLALAAYNAGEGRVRDLLTKHKASSFDDIAVRLPAETQLFVPKVEATIQRREGVALAKLGVGAK